MAGKIYCDTNFLVAIFVKEHTLNHLAVKILKSHSHNQFVLNLFVLEEVIYCLQHVYSFDFAKLKLFTDEILTLEPLIFVEITHQRNLAKILTRYQEKFGLRPRDTLHYLIMKQQGINFMATFDEDFVKKQKELRIKVL